jgi:adenosyl cobinamide kinase/adenosyl cobinamide phosphate guanylyltransferase
MSLVLLLGGARSGKSTLAVGRGRAWGGDVVFVATAEARDADMRARIERHRRERPAGWAVVEEPRRLASLPCWGAGALVIVDCLTLWVANLLEAGCGDDEVAAAADELAALAAARAAPAVLVSNEVGLGVVPATPLGRRYRDVLGRVNCVVAARADEALLLVAGRELRLA